MNGKLPLALVLLGLVALGVIISVGNARALDVGARAPEIGLADFSGRRVTMASLRGRVVLVDIWASWCEPCAQEMPLLQRLYQQYRGQGLSVVGISVDRNIANARQFVSRHRVTFPVIHDAGQRVARSYGVPAMPSSYVIDRNGIVRHVHAGFRASDAPRLEREVQALLRVR